LSLPGTILGDCLEPGNCLKTKSEDKVCHCDQSDTFIYAASPLALPYSS
jgi:hypothetical protein